MASMLSPDVLRDTYFETFGPQGEGFVSQIIGIDNDNAEDEIQVELESLINEVNMV